MEITELHVWTKVPVEAVELQKKLAAEVVVEPARVEDLDLIAGADVSSIRFSRHLWGAVVVWSRSRSRIVDEAYAEGEVGFPYIPGLLSFREMPVLIQAFRHLQIKPQAVLADGQGLAHPRSLGLACHLGLWLNLPTVGCAKTRLVGQAADPGPHSGDWAPLTYRNRTIGCVLRTRALSNPLYISPGHLIDVDSSRRLVLACCLKARLPEPTRMAHLAVNSYRRSRENTANPNA